MASPPPPPPSDNGDAQLQSLLEQDGWKFDHAHVGKAVRRQGGEEGTVLAYKAPFQRHPPLWRCKFSTVWVDVVLEELRELLDMAQKRLSSLSSQDLVISKFALASQIEYEAILEHICESQIMPKLTILAVMECILEQVMNQQNVGGGEQGTVGGMPSYYYSSVFSASAGVKGPQQIQVTPQVIAQRIRTAVPLAYNYYASLYGGGEVEERRKSSRHVQQRLVPKPQAVQKGGRIALWILSELLNDNQNTLEAMDEEYDNVYLQPTPHALVVDWLVTKPHKSIAAHAVQQGISRAVSDSPQFILLENAQEAVDHLVFQYLNHGENGTISEEHYELLLKCTTGDKVEDLPLLETSSFARCKFALELVDTTADPYMDKEAEAAKFKLAKAWHSWRFKSIHGGFTKWPSMDSILKSTFVGQQRETAALPEHAADAEAAVATVTDAPMDSTNVTVDDDAAVAAAVAAQQEEEEEAPARRRTTRQLQSSAAAPVFYGGQATLTQKQLLESCLRLLHEASIPLHIMQLVKLVSEEVGSPLQRIRTVMGKLVWKQNLASTWSLSKLLSSSESSDSKMDSIEQTEQETQEQVVLRSYLKTLLDTEVELRKLVLKHMTELPVETVATAADEEPYSTALDQMDSQYYYEREVEWQSEGHEYIGKSIYRPHHQGEACKWFTVTHHVPSKLMEQQQEEAATTTDSPGFKQCREVERRMRFRAVAKDNQDDFVILTQAQVSAGLQAATLQKQQQQHATTPNGHALAHTAPGKHLVLQTDHEPEVRCIFVGHNSVLVDEHKLQHCILLLLDADDNDQKQASAASTALDSDAFWAIVEDTNNGDLFCRPLQTAGAIVESKLYRIGQSDFHPSSPAFAACVEIVEYLKNHNRSQVFMEPVDPVALKIPEYFDIIKHPMDISTLESNLNRGQYSKIQPGASTAGPVAQMLNGSFRDDVVRIFDNAMLFNPPNDWIHTTAASLKKSVLKKIEQLSNSAATTSGPYSRHSHQPKSVYVDDDSDVDMYVYESDRDDEEYGARKRKRSSAPRKKKEDPSTRAIEHAIRLAKTLRNDGLGGPFATIPLETNASLFSLPPEWHCRFASQSPQTTSATQQEMMELLALQRQVEETERASLRRSTRSHDHDDLNTDKASLAKIQYFLDDKQFPAFGEDEEKFERVSNTRSKVETARESMHENYFATLYRQYSKGKSGESALTVGSYTADSFPPFLGRIVPTLSNSVKWEIQSPYVVTALRWVIRGLVESGHLSAVEPMDVNDSPLSTGAVIANNVYFCNSESEPFDILDLKEMQRRKRANASAESSSEEEEVEMSEYEKMRAERVARNAERLKALGLA